MIKLINRPMSDIHTYMYSQDINLHDSVNCQHLHFYCVAICFKSVNFSRVCIHNEFSLFITSATHGYNETQICCVQIKNILNM